MGGVGAANKKGWNEESDEEFKNFDYANTNLNKCNEEELKAHKANMEKGFQANSVRPGDPGYKYDMRVKYEYDANNAAENSWDESDEEVPNAKPA